jgi:hypothetical protein
MRRIHSFLIEVCLFAAGALTGLVAAELLSVLMGAPGAAAECPAIVSGDAWGGQMHACITNLDCI